MGGDVLDAPVRRRGSWTGLPVGELRGARIVCKSLSTGYKQSGKEITGKVGVRSHTRRRRKAGTTGI
jgi:hypothetical protein